MTAQDSVTAALDAYLTDPPRVSSPVFEDLAPDWAELHAAQPSRPPFSHPDFFATWIDAFGEAERQTFLAVRRDDRLIGAVPLTFDGRDAVLLGDHNVSDYAGICTESGEEAAVLASALEWLMEDFCQSFTVWGVREGSMLAQALGAAGERFGWSVTTENEAVSPTTELPGDWDSYVAGLKKKHRHELRRKLRNLEAAATLEVVEATAPADVDAGIEQLLVMMRESREDKSKFLTPTMEGFFRQLASAFAERGMVRLSTLLLDGEPTATVFAFEDDESIYLYNSGYDPEQSDLAVGLLSKALVLRNGIEAGKTTFDFLRGDERYKTHLGGSERRIQRFTLRRQA